MTTKERLHKLVEELSEREADETLRFAVARHEGAKIDKPSELDAFNDASGEAIAAGYRRIPQTAAEDAWAQASARETIREEPW